MNFMAVLGVRSRVCLAGLGLEGPSTWQLGRAYIRCSAVAFRGGQQGWLRTTAVASAHTRRAVFGGLTISPSLFLGINCAGRLDLGLLHSGHVHPAASVFRHFLRLGSEMPACSSFQRIPKNESSEALRSDRSQDVMFLATRSAFDG